MKKIILIISMLSLLTGCVAQPYPQTYYDGSIYYNVPNSQYYYQPYPYQYYYAPQPYYVDPVPAEMLGLGLGLGLLIHHR